MAVQKILLYPQEKTALRTKSETIPISDRRTIRLIRDLKDTLLAHPDGIGLAAPQIGVHLRVLIVRLGAKYDWDDQATPPIALINPEIVAADKPRKDYDGCLSFPGLFGTTTRPHYLRISGLDERGEPLEKVYKGFDAVLVHHEIDHLEGVLFIDHIESPNDLYRMTLDASGKPVRELMSEFTSMVISDLD